MKHRGWLWRLGRYRGPKWLQQTIDYVRPTIGRTILDLVEQLPQFSTGAVYRLQIIRRNDRKRSAELYEGTRPPAGTSFTYSECCLLEIFPIDDFDHLESGIRRLFPRMRLDDRFMEFRASADDLEAAGWLRIGMLIRPGARVLSPNIVEEMELPEYVKSVEIWCHRLLPSLFSVSLHAKLDKSATEALVRVQSSHYLSDVRFWPMIPTGQRYKRTSNLPDAVQVRALTTHLERVRSEIEDCFAPFFSGYFKTRRDRTPRLPAVEVYYLSGVGTGADAFRAWKASSRRWLSSMSFDFSYRNAYRNDHIVFMLNASLRNTEDVPYKLIVLQDEMPHQNHFVMSEDFLTALLPVVATKEFVNSLSVDAGKARRSIYRTLSRRKLLYGLRADIGLSRQLSREVMLVERMKVEFERGKDYFLDSTLTGLLNEPEGGRPERNLFEVIMHAVDAQIETAQNHLKVMQKSFSEYLLIRNMALMYGLTWTILILTILSLIISGVTMASNWQQIQRLWH